ncbi:MAG: ABC transporter ATP-binding protein [Planctomycetes bacterium]|nr:ABC transporter ATP-binding protein [Planctomycetota bacterium]
MTDLAVRAVDVVKHYEEGLVQALRGVSLDVPAGEALAITGPSGSGKTTLLHLLGALDLPTAGKVEVLGQDLTAVADLDRLRSETLGFVFQLHNLIPNLTLRENVMLPAYPRPLSRAERRARAGALLERVGLGHRVDFLPVKCSGGERQRAAIARALMNGPRVLLADEPTGSVDSATGAQILDLFRDLTREAGVTTITITHDEKVAARADRVVHMVDGLLTDLGRPAAAPPPPAGV